MPWLLEPPSHHQPLYWLWIFVSCMSQNCVTAGKIGGVFSSWCLINVASILIQYDKSRVRGYFNIKTSSHWYRVSGGWVSFSKVVATFNHVGGSFKSFQVPPTTRHVWIIPFFQIWGYVLHVSCVITNYCKHQWLTPSRLNSSLGLTGWKHNRKIIIPIFRLVLQNVALPGWFPCILCYPTISPYFPGWVVIAVCGSDSV